MTFDARLSIEQRVRDAWSYTLELVRKILPYVIVGIGVGALVHGFVPTNFIATSALAATSSHFQSSC